jgi:hypothetical protein
MGACLKNYKLSFVDDKSGRSQLRTKNLNPSLTFSECSTNSTHAVIQPFISIGQKKKRMHIGGAEILTPGTDQEYYAKMPEVRSAHFLSRGD